jgi:Ca2+-binding RTX toxin-like protein
MTMIRRLSLLAVLVGAAAPATALAQASFNMPFTGAAYIGTVDGRTRMVTRSVNGQCQTTNIGASNKLTLDTVINGTAAADTLYAPGVSLQFCGKTIQPLNQDGHDLTLNGLGGADAIDSRLNNTIISSGAGADWVAGSGSNTVIFTGSNSDVIFAYHAASIVFAGTGDDLLCVQTPDRFVLEAHGEGHDSGDRFCGVVVFGDGWEIPEACSFPCF